MKVNGEKNSKNKKQQRELKKERADANCRREASSTREQDILFLSSKQQQAKGIEVGRKTKNKKQKQKQNPQEKESQCFTVRDR
jgi:hypothetical protein